MWRAHNYCDAVTDNLIQYREMEIDHIIPIEWFRNNHDLKEFDVDENFLPNCLENFAPVKRGTNKEKSFHNDRPLIRLMLAKARRKKDDVERHMHKLKKEIDSIDAAGQITALNLSPKNLENVIDIILGDDTDFEPATKVTSISNTNSPYFRSETRVSLRGGLPSRQEILPDCTLSFRSLGVRDADVHLNSSALLKTFSPNRRATPKDRKFVLSSCSSNKSLINLGNTRFSLYDNEVKELCSIADDYIARYISELKNLKRDLLRNTNIIDGARIELFRLPLDISELLFQDLGFQEIAVGQYRIEPRRSTINVFDESSNNCDKKVTFVSTHFEGSPFFSIGNPQVSFCMRLDDDYSERISPKVIRNLLADEILSKVIYNFMHRSQSSGLNFLKKRKILSCEQWKQKYWSKTNLYTDFVEKDSFFLDSPSSSIELLEAIEAMQSFFCIDTRRKVFLPEGLASFYDAMRDILFSSSLKSYSWDYISGCLQGAGLSTNISSPERVLEIIAVQKENKSSGLFSYSEIEYGMRYMLEALRKTSTDIERSVVEKIFQKMSPIVNEYHEQKIVDEFVKA